MSQTVSFIANVNIIRQHLAGLIEIRDSLDGLKKISTNISGLEKIGASIDVIDAINENLNSLSLISGSIEDVLRISTNISEIKTVSSKYSEIKSNYEYVRSATGTLRKELDKFFSRDEALQELYTDVASKSSKINKNLLAIQGVEQEVSAIAGVAVSAKNVIEEKYEVYKTAITFKSAIENVSQRIDEIITAVDAKEVSEQNALTTTQNRLLVEQYKNSVQENKEYSQVLYDKSSKLFFDAQSLDSKVARQTKTNEKLAFTVHNIATKLNIELSQILATIKLLEEEYRDEMYLFSDNLQRELTLEIAEAKTVVAKDVVTSQKIVSEIKENLSLLTDAKHRENKNEIRFQGSELKSLIAVSEMSIENKITKGEIETKTIEYEIKLKGYEHEQNKSMIRLMSNDRRIELLTAKDILTDMKIKNL